MEYEEKEILRNIREISKNIKKMSQKYQGNIEERVTAMEFDIKE